MYEYDDNCSYINDPKIEDEKNLLPLFELGLKQFQKYAFSWRFIEYQKEVEVEIDGIPFIGYTDFHFEDKNTKEDFFIDLKTSKMLPKRLVFLMLCNNLFIKKQLMPIQWLWYLKTLQNQRC